MDLVDCPLQWISGSSTGCFGEKKNAHLPTCHLALAAHGAVVAACLPMAMEQLHYLLVNSSVRRSLCKASCKEEPNKF